MISASEAWKNAYEQSLVPETNVELTFWVATDPGYVDSVETVEPTDFATTTITNNTNQRNTRPVTLEHNLWVLDGESSLNQMNQGYVSDDVEGSGATITLTQASVAPIPGVTITWGDYESLGYATSFEVIALKDGEEVTRHAIDNNRSQETTMELDIESYDTITVVIHGWSLPSRRARILNVTLGHKLVFDKNDILSYEHEQQGQPTSSEVTQNTIRFSLDNFDGRWDLSNPWGTTRYLTERLRVDVRYGTSIDGEMEWVPAGRFYLSDWNAPQTGHEASFSARDPLGFMTNQTYEYAQTGSMYSLVSGIVGAVQRQGFNVWLNAPGLDSEEFVPPDANTTGAEVIQMCANAARRFIYYPRNPSGSIWITPSTNQAEDYTIPLALAYSYPDVTLSKALKEVSVAYEGGNRYVLPVATTGETQTVDNPLVKSETQAEKIAIWTKAVLESRTTVKGEYRADPRLDVFDIVTVEGKYGSIYPVMLTYIKYTYNGSFQGSYEGRVITISEEAAVCWE